MTSENSSFINFRSMQKNLMRRRLWLIALALLVFFIYHAGVTIFVLLSSAYAEGSLADSMYGSLLSLNQVAEPVIAVVGAVILGMEGFSWLDRRKEIDFYESLPVSRKKRFWNIVCSSFVIYIGTYLVTLAVGLIIIYANGAGSGQLLCMELSTFVKCLCLFTAVFAVSVFSVMLTGNPGIAVLLTAVMLAYEAAFDLTMQAYCGELLRTYVSEGIVWTSFFSPAAAYGLGRHWINLLEGAVLLIASYFLYRNRRNEDAGRAVIGAPVRWILKIALAVLAALVSGLLFYQAGGTVAGAIAAVLTALVVGAVMEVIYHFNIRGVFRNPAGTLLAAAGAVLILVGFRYDLIGYDRWVPDPSRVASAYVVDNSNYYIRPDGSYVGTEKYAETNMKLTDISAVNAMLEAGEKQSRPAEGSDSTEDAGCTFTIGYRMKDGRRVRRQVTLGSSYADVLDPVTGSEEFKKGYFQVWNDSFTEDHLKNARISYWNGLYIWDSVSGDTVRDGESEEISASGSYEDFRKAYREDLKNFDFSYADSHDPVGQVQVEVSIQDPSGSPGEGTILETDLPVYENFTHTIAFLQKNGIYEDPVPEKNKNHEDAVSSLNVPFRNESIS